jgi:putative transcriptional regulator
MRKLLQELRKKKGLTQSQVAIMVDVSTSYIKSLETGHCKPGRDIMIKLGDFYKTDVKKLFPDIFLDIKVKKLD